VRLHDSDAQQHALPTQRKGYGRGGGAHGIILLLTRALEQGQC
jgi:hypothetical protein